MDNLKTTRHDELDEFDDAELTELYSWIDSIPLSRPKRNLARDFSDGVLVAELIKHCCSQKGLVEMHNYSAANSVKQKEDNWDLLNRKVFRKLSFKLGDDVVQDIMNAKQGVIEKFLMMLRVKLNRAEWELKRHHQMSKRRGGKTARDYQDTDQYNQFNGSPRNRRKAGLKIDTHRDGYPLLYKDPELEIINLYNLDRPEYPTIPRRKVIRSITESDVVPRIFYEDKEQECLAKDETIRVLESKMHRLEHLVHLKDVRIDDLQNTMESLRPTGVRRIKDSQIEKDGSMRMRLQY